jgi:phosphoribosylanthranilate isomerase
VYVKICANTNLEDALLAVELGADAVGFVFAPSKRRVTAEEVAEITRRLPETVEKVGVFTTRDLDEVVDTAIAAGLTAVQVHSAFDPEFLWAIRDGMAGEARVIQVVEFPEDAGEAEEKKFEETMVRVGQEGAVDWVLLDTAVKGSSGGTGVAFDWERAAELLKRAAARLQGGLPPLILAGGLKAENVGEAIAALTPWGVDVASGVEAEPGKKDPARLRAFIAAANERR